VALWATAEFPKPLAVTVTTTALGAGGGGGVMVVVDPPPQALLAARQPRSKRKATRRAWPGVRGHTRKSKRAKLTAANARVRRVAAACGTPAVDLFVKVTVSIIAVRLFSVKTGGWKLHITLAGRPEQVNVIAPKNSSPGPWLISSVEEPVDALETVTLPGFTASWKSGLPTKMEPDGEAEVRKFVSPE
jgi:hypothetical protein